MNNSKRFVQGNLHKLFFYVSVVFMAFIFVTSAYFAEIRLNDEMKLARYAEEAMNYYQNFGQDTTKYITVEFQNRTLDNQINYYGNGFLFLFPTFKSLFGEKYMYDLAHAMVGLMGALVILLTGLLAREIGFGWRVSLISAWLLFLSPRFFGYSLYKIKDIPYALGFLIGMFFIIRLLKELPNPRRSTLIGLTAGIAYAISVRLGGLLLMPYLGLFLLIIFLYKDELRQYITKFDKQVIGRLLGSLLVVCLLGYIIGIFFYPYIFKSPVNHLLEAFSNKVNLPHKIPVIYNGQKTFSTQLPWHYVIKNIYITIPIIVLIGFMMYFLLAYWLIKQREQLVYTGILAFACLFPIAFVIYQNSSLYCGWHHLLFIYPYMILLSAITIDKLIFYARSQVWTIVVLTIVVGLLARPAYWIVKHYPYQYLYFNLLTGTFSEAFDKQGNDCSKLGNLKGFRWLVKKQNLQNKKENVTIYSNTKNVFEYLSNQINNNINVKYGGHRGMAHNNWDYAIMSTHMLSPKILDINYPPKGTFGKIMVSGVPITCVVKRKNYYDYKGIQMVQQENFKKAAQYLKKAYDYNPNNFGIWPHLGLIYSKEGKYDKAIEFLFSYEQLYPAHDWTKALLARAYFQNEQYRKALKRYSYLLNNGGEKYKKHRISYLIGLCLNKMDQNQKAIRYLQKSLELKKSFKPAKELLQKIS